MFGFKNPGLPGFFCFSGCIQVTSFTIAKAARDLEKELLKQIAKHGIHTFMVGHFKQRNKEVIKEMADYSIPDRIIQDTQERICQSNGYQPEHAYNDSQDFCTY